jgi:hypothetical protein
MLGRTQGTPLERQKRRFVSLRYTLLLSSSEFGPYEALTFEWLVF